MFVFPSTVRSTKFGEESNESLRVRRFRRSRLDGRSGRILKVNQPFPINLDLITGVGKVRPAGQIRPAEVFCPARPVEEIFQHNPLIFHVIMAKAMWSSSVITNIFGTFIGSISSTFYSRISLGTFQLCNSWCKNICA